MAFLNNTNWHSFILCCFVFWHFRGRRFMEEEPLLLNPTHLWGNQMCFCWFYRLISRLDPVIPVYTYRWSIGANEHPHVAVHCMSESDTKHSSSGSRGALGDRAPLQDFFKIMQFSGNFKGKTPILSKFWAQGPPLGSKLRWPPDQNPGSNVLQSSTELCLLNRGTASAICS